MGEWVCSKRLRTFGVCLKSNANYLFSYGIHLILRDKGWLYLSIANQTCLIEIVLVVNANYLFSLIA